MDYPLSFVDQLKPHLRALRKARGWTQVELARRLGVAQSRVADIERKPETMSVDYLFKVLAVLDVQLVLRETATTSETGVAPFTPPEPAKGVW